MLFTRWSARNQSFLLWGSAFLTYLFLSHIFLSNSFFCVFLCLFVLLFVSNTLLCLSPLFSVGLSVCLCLSFSSPLPSFHPSFTLMFLSFTFLSLSLSLDLLLFFSHCSVGPPSPSFSPTFLPVCLSIPLSLSLSFSSFSKREERERGEWRKLFSINISHSGRLW